MSSYNETLQSNNIDLQAILDTINELPEAGGASSGEQVDWSANEDAIISKTISGSYFNDRVQNVGTYAFYTCKSLITVNFPACEAIQPSAFYNCTSLTTVNFPACEYIRTYAFYSCTSLTTVNFPACEDIAASAFYNCRSLTAVNFPACTIIRANAFANCKSLTAGSFPACTTISNSAFNNCNKLSSLTLTGSSVITLFHKDAFDYTPMSLSSYLGYYGSIYVPASLLTSYQTATNWTYFSSRFVGIITFTINGIECQAEGGITWEEWIQTYNSNNWDFRSQWGMIYEVNSNKYLANNSGEKELVTSTIINGNNYSLIESDKLEENEPLLLP